MDSSSSAGRFESSTCRLKKPTLKCFWSGPAQATRLSWAGFWSSTVTTFGLVACALIGQSLSDFRLDSSDLIQETFLKAARDFSQFLGESEPELTAWLRQILVRTLANQAKHHRPARTRLPAAGLAGSHS